MNKGKGAAGKITLGMLKGKPITTSVPSFSFRFNAEDEELEELHPLEQHEEVAEEEVVTASPSTQTPATSRDPSPMHKAAVKRSASLEDSPGSSNTMRLFNELKGKITKTVEEKLNEIKSEKKQKTAEEKRKMLTSKENSSISDSEECLVASKDQSLQSTVPTTPDTATPEPPEVAATHPLDISPSSPEKTKKLPDLPLDTSTPVKTGFFQAAEASLKNKIRPKISELRRRKKSASQPKAVEMSQLEGDKEPSDVENAEEVQEENDNPSDENTTANIPQKSSPPKDDWSVMAQLRVLIGQRAVQWVLAWWGICMVLPVPSTLRDFILGGLVTHAIYAFLQAIFDPPEQAQKPLKMPPLGATPIVKVAAAKEYCAVDKFEGWMNELAFEYDPETYHINQTRSVFVRLEGCTLRISMTRQKVRSRAMWNETPPRLNFYHQRFFDIHNCTVKLLPDGLARKRLWSKKYPICIQLKKDSKIGTSVPDEGTFKDVIEDLPEEDTYDDENSEDDTFFKVTNPLDDNNQLILFARTDREKDEWLRRFAAATHISNGSSDFEDSLTPSIESANTIPEVRISPPTTPVVQPEIELQQHLSRFLQQQKGGSAMSSAASSPRGSPVGSPVKCPLNKEKEAPPVENNEDPEHLPPPPPDTAWFNALLGRVLFDVLRDTQWSNWVKDRIQRKLSTVKLPAFMEELLVSELDLGVALPVVHGASAPYMDARGLWVDLEVSYEGSAKICVETKLNLVKLTRADSLESSSGSNSNPPPLLQPAAPTPEKSHSKSPIFDSDLEDSAESSSDEEVNESIGDEGAGAGATSSSSGMGKMLFRMATKITTSKYFQQASEISYIRRAMEEVSNTRVMVVVELKGLVGLLAVNFPPPPSDRLWYGFRGNPELRLAAKAKLGDRLVTLSQVTDFIENKLCVEFQKVFVLPNMDELIVPVMNAKVPN